MCLALHCAADATSLAGEPSTGALAAAPESPTAAGAGFETAPTVAAWGQPAAAAAWGQPAAAAASCEAQAAGDLPASLSSSQAGAAEPQLAPAGAELAQASPGGDAAAKEGGTAEAAGAETASAEAAADAKEESGETGPGSPSDSLVLRGSVNQTLLMPGKAAWRRLRLQSLVCLQRLSVLLKLRVVPSRPLRPLLDLFPTHLHDCPACPAL